MPFKECKLTNPKYTHIFFDLDHTIWDFDKNAEDALHGINKDIIIFV